MSTVTRHHAFHQQGMPRRQQLETAVNGKRRRGSAGNLRESCLCLQHVQRRGDEFGALHVVGAAAEPIGQLEKNSLHFLGFVGFECDDVVVDFDRGQWLEEERSAARGGAVHQARKRAPVLCLHQQDEATVPLRDDLILQVLRRVFTAHVAIERFAQLRPLAAQLLANRCQPRAGVIGDIARGVDAAAHVRNLLAERRCSRDHLPKAWEITGGAAHRGRRRLDGFEVVGKCQEPKRLQRPAVDGQQSEELREIVSGAKREDRVVSQVADGFRRGCERLAYACHVGLGLEARQASGARRRQGEAPHRSDNPVEFKGPQGAWVHAVIQMVWGGLQGASSACTISGGNPKV